MVGHGMTGGTSTMVAPVIWLAVALRVDSYSRLPGTMAGSDVPIHGQGAHDASISALHGRAARHLLVRARWLWQRCAGDCGPDARDRPAGRLARIRTYRPDHGVCHRPRIGMSLEP